MKKIATHKHYYAILSIALGLSFSGIAQKKNETQNEFVQPKSIIEIDVDDEIQSKSRQYQKLDSRSLFEKYLGLAKGNSHVLINHEKDDLGFVHEKCKQVYKGLDVAFGSATINRKNGKAVSIHGEYYNVKNVDTKPSISESQALQKAIARVGAKKYSKPVGELLILPALNSKNGHGAITQFNLAYKFDIRATSPHIYADVYIDAHTGSVLLHNNKMMHGHDKKHVDTHKKLGSTTKTLSVLEIPQKKTTVSAMERGIADTRYSGRRNINTTKIPQPIGLLDTHILHDTTRGDGIHTFNANSEFDSTGNLEFMDTDNNWSAREHDNSDKDNAALDVHWGLGETYDYFSTIHNRNSYDGLGGAINAYAHYGDQVSNAIAFAPNTVVFGDGDREPSRTQKNDAYVSLDFVAHEYGHLILNNEVNGVPFLGEAAAINEGVSDIWAALVEHHVKGNRSDTRPLASVWKLAEDFLDNVFADGQTGLRLFSDPKAFNDQDTHLGTNWNSSGIHSQGQVMAHWFYLLAVGSQNTDGVNDFGKTFNIRGIGIRKASQIIYRALTQYFTINVDYRAAREATVMATRDLFRAGSIEEQTVIDAWDAVNLDGYCIQFTPTGDVAPNNGADYISNVSIGSINNTSQSDNIRPYGYANFTGQITNLTKGAQSTISITSVLHRFEPVEEYGVSVWIDYNQDKDFEDAGEQVYLGTATELQTSGTFVVPNTATNGVTRMRVLNNNSGFNRFFALSDIHPCNGAGIDGFGFSGEVEDYTVNIIENSARSSAKTNSQDQNITISPNPFQDNFTINTTDLKGKDLQVKVYDISGKLLIEKKYEKTPNQIEVGKQIKTAGSYFVELKSETISKTIQVLKL